MEISLVGQVSNFFFSVLFGAALGVLYDLFKTLIVILKPNVKKLFVSDVVYLNLCGLFSFLFTVAVNKGEIRFYLFAGEMLGWLLYHFTLGKVVFRVLASTVKFIERVVLKVIKLLPPIPKVDISSFKIFKKVKKQLTFNKLVKTKLNIGNIKRRFNRTN